MLKNCCLSFFLGLAFTILLGADIFFIFTVSTVAFFFYLIVLKKDIYLHVNKGHILYSLLSFIFGVLYPSYFTSETYSYFDQTTKYEITGKVRNIIARSGQISVSLEPETIVNLATNESLDASSLEFFVTVSPLSNYEIFDTLRVVGYVKNNTSNFNLDKERFISRKNAELHRGVSQKYVSAGAEIQQIGNNKSELQTILLNIYSLSETLKSSLDKHINQPYLGVAKGVTFGEQDQIEKDIKDKFIESGLIHVLVLSGANISFIIFLVYFLLYKFSKINRIVLTSITSILFVCMTGFSVPSLRALFMTNLFFWFEYFGKVVRPVEIVMTALFLFALISPYKIFYDASLHLSFLAIISLIFLTPKIEEYRLIKNEVLNKIVSIFLSINLLVGPYVLAMSQKINLLSVFSTIIVEPLIFTTMTLTLAGNFIGLISNYAGFVISILITILCKMILVVVELMTFSNVESSLKFSYSGLELYYLVIFLYFKYFNFNKKYE